MVRRLVITEHLLLQSGFPILCFELPPQSANVAGRCIIEVVLKTNCLGFLLQLFPAPDDLTFKRRHRLIG